MVFLFRYSLLSTIQQVDRVISFVLPVNSAITRLLLFFLFSPACAVSGAALLWLEKMPPTGATGVPSVTGLLLLGGITTALGQCGGWWRTGFASSQNYLFLLMAAVSAVLLEVSSLLLLSAARV